MIEKIVLDYLQEKITSVNVYAEVPKDLPGSFITIERTGGFSEDKVRSANIAVQSWATSLFAAAALAEEVITAMEELPYSADIGGCKPVRHYNFTDTATKRYRYQTVYQITHY